MQMKKRDSSPQLGPQKVGRYLAFGPPLARRSSHQPSQPAIGYSVAQSRLTSFHRTCAMSTMPFE